jgi:hypothetical protein
MGGLGFGLFMVATMALLTRTVAARVDVDSDLADFQAHLRELLARMNYHPRLEAPNTYSFRKRGWIAGAWAEDVLVEHDAAGVTVTGPRLLVSHLRNILGGSRYKAHAGWSKPSSGRPYG